MAAITGSRYGITYVLTLIHDSNEISTAIPMFLESESGNTTRLLQRLHDVWICEESKMAHIN